MTKWFHVGTIVNTHGIRGEVRVVSKTDFAEERYKIGNLLYVFMDHSSEPIEVKVKSHRVHKSFDLLSFEGYDNINLVEKFKGAALKVPESQLGQLGEGEYYFHEIIGCTVITEEGETIGIVEEILTPGANDVWVVKRKHEKDALIPYIDDVVIRVNPEEKKITIRPMEGLLE